MQSSEKMNLTASARLIMQLGEQLIEDELIALLELIKNAYDADANSVDVIIDTKINTPYGKGKIEIIDDGNGMLPSIVRNSFLRLSTSFKEEEKSSIFYKRRVLGKKGIGRLSFQRLGNYITVQTVPDMSRFRETNLITKTDIEFETEYNKIDIDIDWSEFPVDMDFSDIVADVDFKNDVNTMRGTRIIIQGIKNLNFWTMDKKKEEKLKNELLNMMDPFQKKISNDRKKNKFIVSFIIDGKTYSVNQIDEDLLDELYDSKVSFNFKDWKLHITIQRPLKYVLQRRSSMIKNMKTGGFKVISEDLYEGETKDYLLDFSDIRNVMSTYPKINFVLEKIKFYDNEELIEIEKELSEDKITKEEYNKKLLDQYAYPGDFEGKLYARDLSNKEELDIILQKEGLINSKLNTLKDINNLWSAIQGIYIYRNGFRILPYGQKDWIGFTGKSQTSFNNIYKQHTVIGYVKIDGFTSENLEEQTNRQGFIQDEFGKNFFTLIQEFLLNIIVDSDVSFREGFTKFDIRGNEVTTKNKKIIFEKIIELEEEKNQKMADVKSEIEGFKNLFLNNNMRVEIPKRAIENLQQKIIQYEEVEKKSTTEKKQEMYLISKQMEEIKDIVPLLGLGIIAESLTHEMNRIEQSIEDCARESIKNKNDPEKVIKNQRNIITQTNFLKIQLAHLESTYRKNFEKQETISLLEFFNSTYVNEDSPMSRKASRAKVSVKVTGNDITIRGNRGILTTIFDNIFLNALYWVQYSEDEKNIFFNIQNNGHIECYDTGGGVHPDIESKLFEPFQFMKKDGRGLGLFIVKELAESMNVRVWLSDERKNERRYKFMFDFSERVE